MRYAQKDIDMDAYPVSVQINNQQFQAVPELENVIQVPLTTITFRCPGQNIPPIQHAPDDTIFRVEVREPAMAAPNSLQVEQYPVTNLHAGLSGDRQPAPKPQLQ